MYLSGGCMRGLGEKYSRDQLKVMANAVLEDEAKQGHRSFILYMKLSQITGLAPSEIKRRIRGLAA